MGRIVNLRISLLISLFFILMAMAVLVRSAGPAKEVKSKSSKNKTITTPIDNGLNNTTPVSKPKYVPDVVIFKLRNPEGKRSGPPVRIQELVQQRMERVAKRHNLKRKTRLFAKHKRKQFKHIYRANLPNGRSPVEAAAKLKVDPDIEWAEPDYYRYFDQTEPNDPSYSTQEHLPAVFAPEAWDVTTGDPNVVIAIIDTGVDYNHPDLAANIWHNLGEIEGDRIDNDENGYIDDIIGWDYGQLDNDPNDHYGHGTHVAGIAAAVGNNGIGGIGITWNCKIMALRIGFISSHIAEALVYAADNGADLANMSFGGLNRSILEKTAVDYAFSHGCVLVASAGNDENNKPHYPSSYNNVLSVAATSMTNDSKAYFSNYGLGTDVAAPGVDIYSTFKGGDYVEMSGTSMSSPLVAGLAALVKSAHPQWNAQKIIDQIIATADYIEVKNPLLDGKLGAGRVNAAAAVGPEFTGTKLHFVNVLTQDTIGDNDDELEPGETISLYATIKNFAQTPNDIIVSFHSDDPYITILNDTSSYGRIRRHRSATNTQVPLTFHIDSNTPPDHIATFQLKVMSDSQEVASKELQLKLAPTWRNPVEISQEGLSSAVVRTMPDGRILMILPLYTSPRGIFYSFREVDGSLSIPKQINNPSYHAYNVDLDLDPVGNAYMAFQRQDSLYDSDYDIWYKRLDHSTGAWSYEGNIARNVVPVISLGDFEISADSSGMVHAVWIDNSSGEPSLYYRYRYSQYWYSEQLLWRVDPNLKYPDITMVDTSDGVRHLFIQYHSAQTTYVITGSGNSWNPPLPLASFYMEGSPFLYNDRIFMLYRSTATSDPLELAEFVDNVWIHVDTIGNIPYTVFSEETLVFDQAENMRLVYEKQPAIYWMVKEADVWSIPLKIGPDAYYLSIPQIAVDNDSFDHVIPRTVSLYYPGKGRYDLSGPTFYLTNAHLDDSLFPSRPIVLDLIDVTATPNTIEASWSSSDPNGIADYEYSIGTAPGEGDLRSWVSAGTDTNTTVDLSITPLVAYQQYFVSVRTNSHTVYSSPVGFSDGITYRSIPLTIDRSTYSCSDSIGFSLDDLEIKGKVTQNITVETDGGDAETVVLTENPSSSGLFQGSLTTNSEPVITEDGTMQVIHGEDITATYEDLNDGTGNPSTVKVTAVVDCLAPLVSDVNVRTGRTAVIIKISTDEPSSALVRYGLSPNSLSQAAYSHQLSLPPSLTIYGLDPNTAYSFVVEVTDEAGNVSVDDNHGNCYSFETKSYVFADPNLKAAVEEALGISNPSETDLLFLTNLTAEDKGIVDLTGLEWAKKLKKLELSDNQINDISVLSELTNLEYLSMYYNDINDISSLCNLTKLTELYLGSNKISDFPDLSGLSELRILDLGYNEIESINLAKLPNLRRLCLENNRIRNISALSGLNELYHLVLKNNEISNISELSKLSKLWNLYLSDNIIEDITPLGVLYELKTLVLTGNRISDISVISGLTDLTSLYLYRNQISDISSLTELSNLEIISMRDNLLNTAAYCKHLLLIQANNPDVALYYDPNPNPLTEDCSTEKFDLSVFVSRWLEADCNELNNWCGWADLDHVDGVDMKDYAEFAWYFTPPPLPGQAYYMSPANGAIGVSQNANLFWMEGSGATSHDVYFGTSNPPAFQGNQTAITFYPSTMAPFTTYYWRIDEVNQSGKTTGVVWSFTTKLDPPPLP